MIDNSEFKLKDFKLSEQTLMGGWTTNHNVIDDLWNYYKQNKESHKPGVTYNPKTGGDTGDKLSTELSCYARSNHYPIKKYLELLTHCFDYYSTKYEAVKKLISECDIIEDFNIQYYKPGEGFKNWHCERGNEKTIYRTFVFMTYLNDVEDGGTAFLYQNLELPAKKGLTLIWPSDWTHTHRGIISHTSDKMIVTGWISIKGNK